MIFFSTKHLLYVSFTTLKRTAQVFNRGFFGLYDFSDEYVKLGHQCNVFVFVFVFAFVFVFVFVFL